MINTIDNQIKVIENTIVDLTTFRDTYMEGFNAYDVEKEQYNAWIAVGAAIISLHQARKHLEKLNAIVVDNAFN